MAAAPAPLQGLTAIPNGLGQQLVDLRTTVDTMRTGLNNSNVFRQQITARIQTVRDAIRALPNYGQQMEQLRQQLQQQIDALNQEVAARQADVQRLTAEGENSTREIQARDQRIQEILASIGTLNNELQAVMNEVGNGPTYDAINQDLDTLLADLRGYQTAQGPGAPGAPPAPPVVPPAPGAGEGLGEGAHSPVAEPDSPGHAAPDAEPDSPGHASPDAAHDSPGHPAEDEEDLHPAGEHHSSPISPDSLGAAPRDQPAQPDQPNGGNVVNQSPPATGGKTRRRRRNNKKTKKGGYRAKYKTFSLKKFTKRSKRSSKRSDSV